MRKATRSSSIGGARGGRRRRSPRRRGRCPQKPRCRCPWRLSRGETTARRCAGAACVGGGVAGRGGFYFGEAVFLAPAAHAGPMDNDAGGLGPVTVDGQTTEGGVEVAVGGIGWRWDGWCDVDRRTDGPRHREFVVVGALAC
jgi:hypothetical protein